MQTQSEKTASLQHDGMLAIATGRSRKKLNGRTASFDGRNSSSSCERRPVLMKLWLSTRRWRKRIVTN